MSLVLVYTPRDLVSCVLLTVMLKYRDKNHSNQTRNVYCNPLPNISPRCILYCIIYEPARRRNFVLPLHRAVRKSCYKKCDRLAFDVCSRTTILEDIHVYFFFLMLVFAYILKFIPRFSVRVYTLI